MKPIQDKVYNAIETIATSGNYGIVFDQAGSLTILYGDSKLDKSDDVLEKPSRAIPPRGVSSAGFLMSLLLAVSHLFGRLGMEYPLSGGNNPRFYCASASVMALQVKKSSIQVRI